MEHVRAMNALEPFLALSKSATSPRAAADLITQATSHPNTFFFAELLHTPNIHALLDSPDYASHYKLLEIFSWGTIHEYNTTPNLPTLSPKQHQKLLLLSLIPLAQEQANLTYSNLQAALSLSNQQALESLVTTAIYSGLITGALDPYHKCVNINSVAPLRDLRPGSVPTLDRTLEQWSHQCTNTLGELAMHIEAVKLRAKEKGEREDRLKRLIEERVETDEKKGKRGAGDSALNEDEGFGTNDAMDLDGSQTRAKGVKRFWRG